MTTPSRREALKALSLIDPRAGATPSSTLWAAQSEYQLIQAAKLAGGAVSKSAAKAFASAHAKEFAADRVSLIADSTRAQLRDLIVIGVERGATAEEIAASIVRSGMFAVDRAKTIALTEVTRSIGAAHVAGYRAAGVEAKTWTTTSGNVREAHAVLDGVTIGVDEYFVASGARALAPGGFNVPALDINCRCLIVPERGRRFASASTRAAMSMRASASTRRKRVARAVLRSSIRWRSRAESIWRRVLAAQARSVADFFTKLGADLSGT